MTSPDRRDLLRRMLGIGLWAAVGGCGPSDTSSPPGKPGTGADSTKTPQPPDANGQVKFDPRRSSKARASREAETK